MSDQFEILCVEKMREAMDRLSDDPYEADEVACSCADFLSAQGHDALSNDLMSKRVMASAARLIPTTTNIL